MNPNQTLDAWFAQVTGTAWWKWLMLGVILLVLASNRQIAYPIELTLVAVLVLLVLEHYGQVAQLLSNILPGSGFGVGRGSGGHW